MRRVAGVGVGERRLGVRLDPHHLEPGRLEPIRDQLLGALLVAERALLADELRDEGRKLAGPPAERLRDCSFELIGHGRCMIAETRRRGFALSFAGRFYPPPRTNWTQDA